jgi:hypothetical protein
MLYIYINLFIASSGAYDPLKTNYSALEPGHISDHEDVFLLPQALRGPVQNSADYPRERFEIGETLSLEISVMAATSEIPRTLRLFSPLQLCSAV